MERIDKDSPGAFSRFKSVLALGAALASISFMGNTAQAAETIEGVLFQPPFQGKEGLSRGCDLDLEKNVTSLSAAYFPEEETFCFRTTDIKWRIQSNR